MERNGEVTRFDYDAQGMLVGKQLPDGTYERWTWDGMGLVARGKERYINEGHITGGLPLVSQTSEGVHYHQHDHLGTTVASYSTDGIASYKTTVFGKGELEDSRAARFTSKSYDADLGAYVFPFRNYDPEAARWMSADPAAFPDGPNNHFYAAVPTMGVDPLGLATLVDTREPAETVWAPEVWTYGPKVEVRYNVSTSYLWTQEAGIEKFTHWQDHSTFNDVTSVNAGITNSNSQSDSIQLGAGNDTIEFNYTWNQNQMTATSSGGTLSAPYAAPSSNYFWTATVVEAFGDIVKGYRDAGWWTETRYDGSEEDTPWEEWTYTGLETGVQTGEIGVRWELFEL